MKEYQELYNELTTKIKELKIKNQELKTKKDEAEKEYRKIENNIQEKEQELANLEEERKQIIIKQNSKTIISTSIIFTVIVLLSWIIAVINMPQLTGILSTILTNLTDLAIIFLAGFIVIPGIFFIEFIPSLAIIKVLLKRNIKKVKNSDEYQNIQKQIEILKQEIEQKQIEKENKHQELSEITETYLHNNTELTMKKSLINYIEKDISNNQINKQEQVKPHTRRKTLD